MDHHSSPESVIKPRVALAHYAQELIGNQILKASRTELAQIVNRWLEDDTLDPLAFLIWKNRDRENPDYADFEQLALPQIEEYTADPDVGQSYSIANLMDQYHTDHQNMEQELSQVVALMLANESLRLGNTQAPIFGLEDSNLEPNVMPASDVILSIRVRAWCDSTEQRVQPEVQRLVEIGAEGIKSSFSRSAAGAVSRRVKKAGRPRLPKNEIGRRKRLEKAWKSAKEAGKTRKEFAVDQNIGIDELVIILNWVAKDKSRQKTS